jgi:peptidoglycan/LPS O-acetylase OafA/YrhL
MTAPHTAGADRHRRLSELLRHRHLPGLDGLRAVSVFVVIVYHFGINAVPGDLGVSGFFVLSGFLITWLLLRELQGAGTISLPQFYARRFLRIFPAYYAFLAASFLYDRLRGDIWPHGLGWSGLFYFVNYFNATHGHPDTSIAHAWSLSIEEQFYLLWPLALLLLSRTGRRWFAPALVAVTLAVVAWRSFLFLHRHVGVAYVYNAFDTRFDNLAVGCLLAVCADREWFERLATRLASNALLPCLTIVLLAWSRIGTSDRYHYTLGYTVDAVLLAAFILQILLLAGTPAWRWLEHPAIRYLGTISYPLYLWHAWGLTIGMHFHAAGRAGQFAAGVVASIALASGSYFVVERPFLRLKSRFSSAPG